MRLSARDILEAFIEQSAEGERGAVSFGLRAPNPFGYIKVWGPSADRKNDQETHLSVERYNGAVVVSREIASHVVHAVQRPNENIMTNQIGGSAGTQYGRFTHAIPPSVISNKYGSAKELVADLIAAIEKTGQTW